MIDFIKQKELTS